MLCHCGQPCWLVDASESATGPFLVALTGLACASAAEQFLHPVTGRPCAQAQGCTSRILLQQCLTVTTEVARRAII